MVYNDKMIIEFTKKQVETSFRKFNDYSKDLVSSDWSTFRSHLEIWLDHCENDEVMKAITSQLKNQSIFDKYDLTFIGSGGGMVGCSKVNFPIDEYERDAFIYQLLLKIRFDTDIIINMGVKCQRRRRIDDWIYWFNEKILNKLIRSLEYELREIQNRIKLELSEDQNVPVNFFLIFQDNSVKIDNSKIKGKVAVGKNAEIKN